jgi:hypothetical protein
MRKEHDRFLEKIEVSENGCWIWKGAKLRGGYGHFRRHINGKWVMFKAHRYAYEYFNGPLEKHLLVCHKCDNPECVNPEHLFKGTNKDNAADKVKKGRLVFGRNKKHQWLTLEIVNSIRKDHKEGLKNFEISEKYEISPSQVSRVVKNQIWKERKVGTEN